METLGERLKDLREKRKLLQKEVANELGIKAQTYSRYENNLRAPDIPTLIKLADYYNVTTDYLLGREEFTYLEKNQILNNIKDIQRILSNLNNYVESSK